MITDVLNQISASAAHFSQILFYVNVILHFLFAAAIARDAGNLHKRGLPTQLVSGFVWAFATLLGGVWTALIYWLMHHSSLARR
ncbi:hypothetical protein PsalN5692_00163 [Piscirickettsia salmonis]|uniref:hypothetical protein n=1 Tax=Piscirickettsia salmonis TaxID=1238 RepID=UPI0012B84383|nr:hypothetical protein [Piscirickettsia salmonis]QGP48758.1 hypothetical protein PsalN5692_00163 [Piscirickettsia salmonis]QGP52784.1 hypothetical protein PsalSR1_00175 [Piscirickettsia salmonis]QGP57647.1 hypothetical protein PsalBI1_00185 [Piscirickettsia salmonis]QGP62352.1 hypothetical protein PsalMR5_00175 [Piscirickettsia salmonis]